MNVPMKTLSRIALGVTLVLFLAACDSRASRSQAAFNKYQAASNAGDLMGARRALLELVAADEDVPSYWLELGKVQIRLGDYPQAFYAFTRANELNRGDAEAVRYLAQIAVQSGDLQEAEAQAARLDLLAPGDPMVKLTNGMVSLQRKKYDEASKQADEILAQAPLDPNAKVLKARALVGLGQAPAAIALLKDQVQRQPQDAGSMRALFNLQRGTGDWAALLVTGRTFLALVPQDRAIGLLTIDAAFRANDIPAARAVSLALLKPDASPDLIDSVLETWRTLWKSPDAVALARTLAGKSGAAQQIVYGHYFNLSGAAATTVAMLGGVAAGKTRPGNADAQAIYYEALAAQGKRDEARAGLEAILLVDQENDLALGALTPLLLQQGDKARALNMARKLVAVAPKSVAGRLILAKSYETSGDRPAAIRALWEALHDIPGEETIYTSLRGYLPPDEARRLDGEFSDQIQRKVMRDSLG